ncbi:hypothetical protein [Rufibacter sp. XAAS-G3-1]|uniref:hypothetical protein n=1 Tax=Rufibacter sp. XAAS-G3-1 TaxID=2729134 RepID=UPI0015E67AED|nr:hypothetical protein [Rufibacter sp. XAAS-G3-1]
MFKFEFCAANNPKKNLRARLHHTVALLSPSKNASAEPLSGHFRLQTSNLDKH